MVLTVIDVLHIQPYIFSTNRLREQVAASQLVEAALEARALARLAPGRRSHL
jgi:hypothetical protein